MRRISTFRCLIIWAFVALVTLAFSACGGGRSASRISPSIIAGPAAVTISDALAELDRMKPPAGVEAATFNEIKAALRSALVARGADKVVCTPPTGDANKVPDLMLVDNMDGTMNLTWRYYNVGDYNQDGIVGIADITPLAMHYGDTREAADTTSFAAVIDGSGDLTVNIADVTPIAMNFGVQFKGYLVEYSDVQDGTYSLQVDIPASFGQGGEDGRIYYIYTFTPEPLYWYRVVPYDNDATLGVPSAAVQAPPPGESLPVASILANPNIGFAPLLVGFNASNSYDPDGGMITKYEWDMDGDGTFEIDGATNPLYNHTFSTAGLYNPALRVTDDEELTRVASTAVTVVAMPDYDEVEPNNDATSANTLPALPVTSYYGSLGNNIPAYLGYDGGLQDWFSFSANPGETITAFCTFSSSLSVGMQIRDSEGDLLAQDTDASNPQFITYVFQPEDVAPYTLCLTGSGFSDYYLNVVEGSAPVADLVVSPSIGLATLNVTLDASASYDDGTITSYEWDFEGDGIWDSNTGTTPITNHAYSTEGIYSPVVRVTDDTFLTATDQATVEVLPGTYNEIEDNDDITQANSLPGFPFAAYLGSLGSMPPDYPGYDGDANDFFSFNAVDGETYSFRLNYNILGPTMEAGMNLYDSYGNMLVGSDFQPGAQLSYTFWPGEGGIAYLEVLKNVGYGDYLLYGTNGAIPKAHLTAFPRNGDAPLTPYFDASGSSDDGVIVKYEFDFNGDGTYDLDNGNDPLASYVYTVNGVYRAAVRVTDNDSFTNSAYYTITVGNTGYNEVEDNDTLETANQLPMLPVIGYQASLGNSPPLYNGYDGDDVDYFMLPGADIETVTVTVTFGPTLRAELLLLDANQYLLGDDYGSSPLVVSYTFQPGDTPPWYAYMSTWEGFGDYSISVQVGAPPTAVLQVDPQFGAAPLLVDFNATGSWDMDGFIVSYDYDWEGDGTYDLFSGTDLEAHEYASNGTFRPTLRVTDNSGYSDTHTQWVFVGDIPYEEREHNDELSTANPIPAFPFTGWSGSVGGSDSHPGYDGDEWDYFTFNALEGETVNFELIFDYSAANIDLSLYDWAGYWLWGSYNSGDNEYLSYTFRSEDVGPYIIAAECWSDGADYELSGWIS